MSIERYETVFGTIFHSSTCKDDYDNIITDSRFTKYTGVTINRNVEITLQRPALKAFKRAEEELGREIKITGSIRSCAQQASLYRSDPSRYASPNTTLHTQGLAIDVSTNDPDLEGRVRKVLLDVKFRQSRPDDEPWHFSYFLKA